MDLFLIRHAIAVPASPDVDDAARPLSERGRERWRRCVRGLARLSFRFERVYHSPFLRAVTTAEMLSDLVEGDMVEMDLLAVEPRRQILERISGDPVALVGHEPWLAQLLALLVFGTPDLADGFDLRKGGVAWLRGMLEPGGMRVRAVLSPKVLLKIE